MAAHSARHASNVVEQFKLMIGDDLSGRIDAEHYAELALMIESAIDTAVLLRMERVSEAIGALAVRVKHDAETYSS